MGQAGEAPAKPFRILPRVTPGNEHFWKGGAEGELRFKRCDDCGYYVHPPVPRCPRCTGRRLSVSAVSGRATVLTYTVNHQPWIPGVPVPYVIAIVEIAEQEGLRLMTNLVHCEPGEVAVGMPVRVVFEAHEDVHVPLFEPAR